MAGPLKVVERPCARSPAPNLRCSIGLPTTDVTGLRLWPCSLHLLEHTIASLHESSAAGRPLRVELGAGTGLVSVGLATALGESTAIVVATDPAVSAGAGLHPWIF